MERRSRLFFAFSAFLAAFARALGEKTKRKSTCSLSDSVVGAMNCWCGAVWCGAVRGGSTWAMQQRKLFQRGNDKCARAQQEYGYTGDVAKIWLRRTTTVVGHNFFRSSVAIFVVLKRCAFALRHQAQKLTGYECLHVLFCSLLCSLEGTVLHWLHGSSFIFMCFLLLSHYTFCHFCFR